MIRIALTGGIACGKSLAASYLEHLGYTVCDADLLAHALYAPGGPAYTEVLTLAGEDAVDADGVIDRKLLGQRVFGDPERLARLNRLLHPLVARELEKWLEGEALAGRIRAVCVVPLLFEAGMEKGWHAVICVGCNPATQVGRLAGRGLSKEAIAARIAAQWPIREKMERADYPIWNDGSCADLKRAIADVVDRIEAEREKEWKNQ